MALAELTAIESAYQTLQHLDDAGRRRALQWLSDALTDSKSPTSNGSGPAGNDTKPHTEASSAIGPQRARRATKSASRPTKAVASGKRTRGISAKAARAAQAGKRIRRARPDADKIMAAYRRLGTISGLANHFKVPAYTVYSWARSLRQEGYEIGRA
jgi:hypothetical protein